MIALQNMLTGAVVRDELAWNEYWLWDPDDMMAAVYYNPENEPEGYVIYRIADEIFYIKDMIFNNEEASRRIMEPLYRRIFQ